MDTLELVPFEGTQLQRVEDINASKFHIKELRFKDLHKNLCKKPYFHVRLDSRKRNSVAEGVEGNGERHRSSLVTSDADYETCEDDGVASVPQDPVRVPAPSETYSEEFPAPEQQPSHRTSKREKRLPGKFHQDGNFFYDVFPGRYLRNFRRGVAKSKVKKDHPSPNKSTEVKPDHIPIQFFEVPIEAHEVDVLQSDATATTSGGELKGLGSSKVTDSYPCTPSEGKGLTRPLKQIYRPRSSSQKRVPATKHARVSIDYTECMEVSSDTEPHEGPSKTPKTSSMKRRHLSPDANTEVILSTGKRAVHSKSKEKTSRTVGTTLKEQTNRTMGIKVKEKKGVRLLESELKRADIADGSIGESLPVGCRLTSPVISSGEIVPTEKKASLESKSKEKKGRTVESKVKEKTGRSLESALKRRNDAPKASVEETLPGKWKYSSRDASAEKRTLERKSKEKKARTTESKWNEKKRRTLETESKRRHRGPDLSPEDILPVNWRLPKEKMARTVESGSKQSYRAPDISTQKVQPLKRKRGPLNASLEEVILPAEKKKAQHSKLNKKQRKDPEVSFDASMEETRPAAKQRTPGGKLKEKKGKTPEVSPHASIEKSLPAESKKPADRKLEEKKSKTPESKVKVKKEKDGKSSSYVRIPIRKLKGGYTDGDGSSDMERDSVGPGTSYPTFATEMKHSNVITCFWMGIPSDFTSRHMPGHDGFVVLQDAKGLKWETNYLARKKGLSGGWRRFALDHHLEMGDIVVFELVKPLKFLVHITKGAGGENPHVAVPRSVKENSKKLPKHQASSATKRVSTLESALFSTRKRMNKDVEGKLPSQKPRSAGGHKQQREGEKRASARLTPVVKPNRLYKSRRSTKDRDASNKDTEHVERKRSTRVSSVESEGAEERGNQRGSPLPKFKRVRNAEDLSKDSQIRKDPQELGSSMYEKSLSMSSQEPQKAGPLAPEPGPTKKKLRRVSYFYFTDEDHSIST